MSIQYHTELFNNGSVKLMVNFSNVKGDIADENLSLQFYAVNNQGVPAFTQELDISEIRVLYAQLNSVSVITDGQGKSSKFIESSEGISLLIGQLEESDLALLVPVLEKFSSDEKTRALLSSLSDLDIENLHGAYHHRKMSIEIENLEKLIELEVTTSIVDTIKEDPSLSAYVAGQPEKIFQNWVESNLWVFGVEYIKKHDARKIAMSSEADLLMESVNGYLDLIELKRPKHKIIKYDSSHNCYYPHPELSIVIGQSLFYLKKLSEYKLILEPEYGLRVIMPRVKIILGRSNAFTAEEQDCLRMLSSSISSVDIITYDDIVTFGKLLIESSERN